MKVFFKEYWADMLICFTAFMILFPTIIIVLIILWSSLFSVIGALL